MSADGFFRVLAVGFRRYARDPGTRPQSARIMLSGALALLAAETSVGEAATTSAEIIAELARGARVDQRKAEQAAIKSGDRA